MTSSFIRIVSLAVLLIALGIFSGGVVLASSAGEHVAVDSCCGGAGEGDLPSGEDDSSPCSSPDCHCLTCLELAVAAVIDLGSRRAGITSFLPVATSRPATPFITPIDQPPEQS
ncbi:hypothetical protein GEOBC_00195 [Geobacteraceae bacterium]|nr:hypothetical protein GEOBC_00195 [Geobacteraceae bacterium]